jgi:sRNA-binding regulator protein Hfq
LYPALPQLLVIADLFKFHQLSSGGLYSMSSQATLPTDGTASGPGSHQPLARSRKTASAPPPFRFPAQFAVEEGPLRQAELFYLQKQIQSQTPMVIVLEDGERIEGCIEWYDRNALKVRGRQKTLIYKSAIKYMYKVGDAGQ